MAAGIVGLALASFALLVLLAVEWPVFVWSALHLRPTLMDPATAIGGGLDLLFRSHPLSGHPHAWRHLAGLPSRRAVVVLDGFALALLCFMALSAAVRLELWRGRSRFGLRAWDPRARLRRRALALPRDLLHLQPRRSLRRCWLEDRAGIGPEVRRRVLRLLAGTRELTDGPGGDSWSLGDCFGRELYSAAGQHALVVGASGSGKSLRAAIRAALEHLGATVVVSTKLDMFEPVALARQFTGRGMRIFAPTLKLDDERAVNWSPLSGCKVWEFALHMGRWIYDANPNLGKRDGGGEFYDREAIEVLLPPLLHAAALAGLRMADVYRWVLGDGVLSLDPAAEILQAHGALDALEVLRGVQAMPDRQRSFTLSAARQLINAYQYRSVCASDADGFDVEAFIRSDETLYICVEDSRADMLAPIIGGLLGAILRACETRAAGVKDTRTLPITKLILDEAAHLTPLRRLPAYLAMSRSWGIRMMVIVQSIGQLRERYHEETHAITSNTLTKIFMGPIHDEATRETIIGLLGGWHVTSVTHNRSGIGRTGGGSEREEYRPKMGAEDLALLPQGMAVVFHNNDLPFIASEPLFGGYRITFE
ncbi:MAG TPA: type IV secretory system conjugative DNA transfer family protein [Conexibacter sp.]|nr:type IV secretory system conjugative DNA transfer family protein [Conexibacter sp.]